MLRPLLPCTLYPIPYSLSPARDILIEGLEERVKPGLTTELKKKARALGFDAVGIASAANLELAESAIRERVESGKLKGYGFARRPAEHFTRPSSVLPGARSIVAAALSYFTHDEPDEEAAGPRGRVARFARGRDYHDVLNERLRELGDWLLREVGGGNYRICVDTGPMIDRAAAREAGIGSYGKNAAIITREAGSWVVLGEIVTDLELPPDEPASLEECGDCSICLHACPSGAIVSPFVIDQTRCISHLTQMRGYIPTELRPLVGDRIYGCDVCQEVCPKNCGAKPGSFPKGGGLAARPELIPLLNISQEEFDRSLGPTAIGWIGRTRFRRNVAVALGNIADPSAVIELTTALSDPDPVVRCHVAWALGRIESRVTSDE